MQRSLIRTVASVLFAVAVASSLAISSADERPAIPLHGSRFAAALTAITAAGQVEFSAADSRRTIKLADLVRWGAPVEPTRGMRVLLAGGGWIMAAEVTADEEQLTLESDLLGRHALGLEFVAGIVWQNSFDPQENDRLANWVASAHGQADRILLDNGDELTGSVQSVNDATVSIQSQQRNISIETDRIAALAFDSALAARPPSGAARTLIGLTDGSRFPVSRLAVAGDKAEFTPGDGAGWSVPSTQLVFLQPLSGSTKYLSDRTAETYKHLPFLTQSWLYRNDANVLGTQLRAGGAPYAKGIGMHSAARLTYRLEPKDNRFEADVALDDHVGRGGAAVAAVYVDGKLAWKSECLRGGMPPVPVHVETRGGKLLSLIVEFAERGDELDRVNWLDARLVESNAAE